MSNLYILAGGRSSRLGFDKTKIKISGVSIIDMIDKNIGTLFNERFIVVKKKDKIITDRFKIVEDISDVAAPIIGIITALQSSSSDKNFICACDMPFIKRELVEYLLDFDGYDAICPYYYNHYEPLCCVYNKTFLEIAEYYFKNGEFSLHKILENTNVKKVDLEILKRYDQELVSFVNINTMVDLEAIEC